MEARPIDNGKVLTIIHRDNPEVLERAMLIVRVEELEEENSRLRAALAEAHQEE